MEHRCTERYNSDLHILIYQHNLPVAIGRIKNGSRWGVYIETDFFDVECEHQIAIEVLLGRNTSTKLQRIDMKAMVIHKTKKGFGAELDIHSEEQAAIFVDLLRGTKSHLNDTQIFAKVANS